MPGMENKLKESGSIYLLRHSENPVPWQLWGEEAFAMARRLGRPVFLSAGYASCHWCRVMEKESFEDEETARILAQKFVPVKLDKDEYPDIDKEYQFYLQSTGEAGGWPLSVFLTPDKEPFFAGTYYPKKTAADKPAFKDLLQNIYLVYTKTPEEVEKVIQVRKDFMKSFTSLQEKPLIEGDAAKTYRKNEYKKIFDKEYGGFRRGPKFPYIPAMEYLAGVYEDEEIFSFLKLTADQLCVSAICDHLYGGFFRYTTDRKWTSPHFEKMITDNAQIPAFLLKMFELTDNRLYLLTAKKALDFILHNMMTDYGILNSIDADSPNAQGLLSEGYFYKVTDRDFSGLSAGELKSFPQDAGIANGVIYLKSAEYIKAAALEPVFEKVAKRAASVKKPPSTDNKVIAGSNFLFCYGLLSCFEISGEDWYMSQALALFQKLKTVLVREGAVFRGSYGDKIIDHRTLEDHVYYLKAVLKFFELTKEKEFAELARITEEEIEKIFVKDGIPCLDTAHRITDAFDDDKPNPIGLYLYLKVKFKSLFSSVPTQNFFRFAEDRAVRFPTGHPTIIRALEYE